MSEGKHIPQMEPWFGVEERSEIECYLDEGGWFTEYKRTTQFEHDLASYIGCRHCIVVNNGTISLTLAALALGLKYGDEVIVPNYTMIATPNSIKMLGCVPVFVDIEAETLCMDISLAKEAITEKTKALFLVTANGRSPKSGVGAFERLCAEHGIALIEDAAQSLGSRLDDGRLCGRAGVIGSLSFSAPKVISTGQGGAVVTDSDLLARRMRQLKDFGRTGGGNDIHDSIGYNFKFTELQACLGLAQLRKLDWRVKRKREIYQHYYNALRSCRQVRFFDQDLSATTPWFIDILAERRDDLAAYLKTVGIGTRTMYPPINRQKAYNTPERYPVSELVGMSGLWLPSASQLTDEQIYFVCSEVQKFYSRYC